jgi:hypothetical protein
MSARIGQTIQRDCHEASEGKFHFRHSVGLDNRRDIRSVSDTVFKMGTNSALSRNGFGA